MEQHTVPHLEILQSLGKLYETGIILKIAEGTGFQIQISNSKICDSGTVTVSLRGWSIYTGMTSMTSPEPIHDL